MKARIGLALATAAMTLGLSAPATAPSAQPWLDMPATTPLDHLDHRLDLRVGESGGGVDLAALAIEIQGLEVPVAAVAPLAAPLLPEPGIARRVGVFFAGVARWIGDRLWTDGLTAGADLAVADRGAVGIAASYMNQPGHDDAAGAESAAIALYGSLTPADGPRLHAMVGFGRAEADGPGAAGAALRFGQIGARWRSDLGGGVSLAKDLRLGVAAGPDAGRGVGYAMHGAADLSLDGAWIVPAGDLGFSLGASWQGALADGGRRDPRTPATRVRFGGRRPLRGDLGLRLGVTLTERTGETYSFELSDEEPGRQDAGHLLRLGWSNRF